MESQQILVVRVPYVTPLPEPQPRVLERPGMHVEFLVALVFLALPLLAGV